MTVMSANEASAGAAKLTPFPSSIIHNHPRRRLQRRPDGPRGGQQRIEAE